MLPLKISLVTVCFNSARTIENTILSILSQQYLHLEYIIIDGGSRDGTVDIIKKFDNVDLLISEPDKGIYDAMNKGIYHATGDIIGFLNADDIYAHPNVLEKVSRVFENDRLEACYGDLLYFSENQPNKVRRYWKSKPFSPGLFAKGWCPPHPTFFCRRALYEKWGGFNLSYAMGNDVELMMRFLEKHQVIGHYIPEVLVKMRLGGASNRNITNIIVQNKNILKAARNLNIPISSFTFYFYKFCNRLSQFIFKPQKEYRHVE